MFLKLKYIAKLLNSKIYHRRRNHSFNEMIKMMISAIGENKKIINIPRFIAVIAGIIIERDFKKKGLEGGLDARFLMQDIITEYLYFDPEDTAKKTGIQKRGDKGSHSENYESLLP